MQEQQRGGSEPELMIVLPLLPGRSEAWRRFQQELQESRRADFESVCRRWGIRRLEVWLASSGSGDMVLVQIALVTDVADVEQRFASSQQPFDRWIKERVRELHGMDLNDGIARYQAEPIRVWSAQMPPAES